MRKLVPLLACLMLVLTTWAGMAHAMEDRGVETSRIDGAVHVAGDGDEVPADADKGYPHHHASCHEHHVGTPAVEQVVRAAAGAGAAPPLTFDRTLTAHLSEAHLRPPQA